MEDAARVLRTHKIGAVPVVRDAQLVGIVTESDLFRALVEMSDPSEAGVRVTFELDEGEDVVATLLQLCEGSGARIASLFALHHHDSRTGDRRRLGVLRLAGDVPESVIDAIWRSRHRVVSVMRLEERVEDEGLTVA